MVGALGGREAIWWQEKPRVTSPTASRTEFILGMAPWII